MLFFNEVNDSAAALPKPLPVLRNYVRKSAADGFGIISETDEPWTDAGQQAHQCAARPLEVVRWHE
jgi:hypothetical protein